MRNPACDSFDEYLYSGPSIHDSIISMCLEDLILKKARNLHFVSPSPISNSSEIHPLVQQKTSIQFSRRLSPTHSYCQERLKPEGLKQLFKHQHDEIVQQKTSIQFNRQLSPTHSYCQERVNPEGLKQLVKHQNDEKPRRETKQNVCESIQISDNDVLLGRGKGVARHEGNINFRKLIVDCQCDYVLAPRPQKTGMARRIVATIRQNNGRFLKQDKSGKWFDVGNQKALEKTSQALREGIAHKIRKNLIAKGFDL